MRHGSLFSGIGGFDLAAEWMGWENVFHCEFNPFCQKILKHYWPDAESYSDIRNTNFTVWRGSIDILSGGDPCQRNSNANRSGDEVAESLGAEYIRAVSESMPGWCVRENPSTVRADAPWTARKIAAALEHIGYIVPEPFKIRACCVGGRIRRERLFVLGCLPKSGSQGLERNERKKMERANGWRYNPNIAGSDWRNTNPEVLSKSYGISGELDGITFSKWKKESIEAYGNAVVPQMPYEIFKAIDQYEKCQP